MMGCYLAEEPQKEQEWVKSMSYRRRRDLPNVRSTGLKATFIENWYPDADW